MQELGSGVVVKLDSPGSFGSCGEDWVASPDATQGDHVCNSAAAAHLSPRRTSGLRCDSESIYRYCASIPAYTQVLRKQNATVFVAKVVSALRCTLCTLTK